MAKLKSSSLHLFMFLFTVCIATTTTVRAQTCRRSGCGIGAPAIRFPFRINKRQPERCGYPGFNLSCNNRSQTIIDLPVAGEFAVDFIDYGSGTIRVSDPENCMANRLIRGDFRVGSPFEVQGGSTTEFVFLNCTRNMSERNFFPISCLSGENYTVWAVFGALYGGAQGRPCSVITTVQVPMQYSVFQDVALTWVKPDCSGCEAQGGTCGFRSDTGLRVGCTYESGWSSSSSKNGLPRGAKYGIIIGVGIPGFLIAIGIVFHLSGKLTASARRRRHVSTMMSTSVAPNPMMIRMGLDRPTIESYPKTMLGESKRLPNPSDDTCAICLSVYQPSEALRTIPDCKHYFHADCIDEWLRLNGTCPMCRKSPEGSLVFTSSSSSSSSSTSHR